MPKRHAQAALLVIDVQHALFGQASLIYNADHLLQRLNTLTDRTRQDGAPVVFFQHINRGVLKKDANGWILHPELNIVEGDTFMEKHNGSALDQLALEVREHSIVGFLGPNGAGKTPTIKTLLGLMHPTGGSATVLGLGVLLGGTLVPIAGVVRFTPWKLADLAILIAAGISLPPDAPIMIASTVIWSVLFLAAAVLRMQRAEL